MYHCRADDGVFVFVSTPLTATFRQPSVSNAWAPQVGRPLARWCVPATVRVSNSTLLEASGDGQRCVWQSGASQLLQASQRRWTGPTEQESLEQSQTG